MYIPEHATNDANKQLRNSISKLPGASHRKQTLKGKPLTCISITVHATSSTRLHTTFFTKNTVKPNIHNQKNEIYSFRVSDQNKSFRSFNQQFHRLACTLNPFNKHKLKTTNTSDINVKDHIMSQNNSWKNLQKTFLN